MPNSNDTGCFRLLSNGSYRVILDGNGAGTSRWRQFEVTRWREDPVRDPWGSFLILADASGGVPWSAAAQPFPDPDDAISLQGTPGTATHARRHGDIAMRLDVAVHADCDAELRRLTIDNLGAVARELVLTSYAEPVLGAGGADASHPAFSKLFVQTEWLADNATLLVTRRKRAASDAQPWCAHFFGGSAGTDAAATKFESDRLRFLGRGRGLRQALALQPGAVLSGTSGCVLDPVLSLRRHLALAPGERAELALWTAMSDSRDGVLAMAARLRGEHGTGEGAQAVFAGADRRALQELARLGLSSEDARQFDQLAAALLQADLARRAPAGVLGRGRGGAPTLWAAGISGDRPIVLLRMDAACDSTAMASLFAAQCYWQAMGLGADVVLLAGGDARALASLQNEARQQTARLETGQAQAAGAVFVLDAASTSDGLRDGLASAARIVLDGASAWSQDARIGAADSLLTPPALPGRAPRRLTAGHAVCAPASGAAGTREFDNGWGGFADDGATYAITLSGDACTPGPWSNVVANAGFGFLVTAEGGGYSWSLNSQQNPLTPWPNDPVSDVARDVIYLRDLDDGALWSATASPARAPAARYEIVHGQGFSRLHAQAHGIDSELLLLVPADDPVKLGRLRLQNHGVRTRRLSVTAYVQWALGANGTVPAPFVTTEMDAATGAVFARNAWRPDFADRVAFFDFGGCQQSCTGDRREFLGALGEEARPAALLAGAALSGRLGAGLDPCTAMQCEITLAPGQGIELLTLLGDASSAAEASALIARYRQADVEALLAAATGLWDSILDTVQVRTPDRAMDIVLNRWLPYQVLGCRLWARTGYYQASGAFGFRDQLQDVMALCLSRPDLARAHILRATARQFTEGDVQHWWLPPSGSGVRTRMSDDLLWLPYVAMHYIGATGDAAVLEVQVPYLQAPELAPGEHERFFRPDISPREASVYEHAAETIDRSLALGAHGLPLIGTGDWNDGMNAVGEGGKGESVWLAWLLLAVIDGFAPVAERRGDTGRAARWRAHAEALAAAVNGPAGWDGDWYRRGYYDDGTPLGSASSLECRIDTIAQSWSVLSGRGDPEKSLRAMASVHELLTWSEAGVAPLFTPPFDDGPTNPGYIKGYPPGIRENGGQYTHGSCWSVFACASLGQGARAMELFDIFNPVKHADTAQGAAHYVVEPYVACADVYSVAPYVGRGGWTWYTGSSGWVYRAGIEAILGFQRLDGRLIVDPCIRADWPGFTLSYRHRGDGGRVTSYEIAVDNPDGVEKGVVAIDVDGVAQSLDRTSAPGFAAIDDGASHRVRVTMGS
ncbi:MAG: glycosyl transferase family 36 [Arenimonas sp.]